MERRDFMKSISAAGVVAVTPIKAHDSTDTEIVLMKSRGSISDATADRLTETWKLAVKGTSLEHAKVVVLCEGLEIELVRKQR